MAITKINTPELFDLGTTNSSLRLPSGDTASRPSNPNTGEWRYNTDDNYVEYWDGSAWFQIDYEAVAPTCTTDTINYPSGTTNTAYYKMSDATDSTLNGYNGTATNVNFNVAGKFGNAGEFNGSSSYISVPNSAGNNMSTFSVSLWFKISNASALGTLISNGLGSDNGYYLGVNVGGTIVFLTSDGNSNTATSTSPSTYADGNWHNVVLAYTAVGVGTSTYNIYVDGNSTPVITGSNGKFTGTSAQPLTIGKLANSSLYYFNGSIDQVRIFSTALTADNVTSLYNEVQCVPAIIPSDYFNPLLYTGNGSTQSIDDLTFQPDLVWIKERTSTSGHHLGDSVRGATKMIYSNLTNAESTDTATITSFDTNGFTVGSSGGVNAGTDNYVAWNWKSGGAPTATNSAGAGNVPTAGSVKIDGADSTTALAGTIAATSISANTEAGFSIVSYTGNNSTFATIAHGLGQAPSVVIVKARNLNAGWPTQHNGMYGLRLNDTGANNVGNGSGFFSNTPPNSSVFTVGGSDEVNDGYNYIAYCFASIPGFSDIGSYIGTGASGNSIVTGFRPAYLMVKRTDSGDNWLVFDNKRNTTNPTNLSLIPNSSAAESVGNLGNGFSFLSNGFEVVSTDSGVNANGGSYIFMVFAEEVYNANAVTANQTNPFNDGSQVAQYEFEDNAYDSQPNGYIGKGGTFNGSSSVITIPNIKSQLQSGASFTISCWVNVSSSQSGEAMIINTAASSGTQGVNIGIRASTGLVYFQIRGNNNLNASGTTNLVGAGWKNIVLTHTTSSTILYVNGTQEASIGANTIGTIPNDLTFGKWASSSLYYLNGSIDQVRIYNTALNPNDVWLLYSETSATSSTLDYPASTGAQALYELEGNANDTGGTYNGTATDVAWVPLYDGTPTSMTYAAPSVSTPFLKAGDFNGSSSYIDTSIPLNSNLGSVSLWVKTSDTIATFFGVNANSDSNRFYFGVRNSNFWTGAGNLQKYTVSASNLIDNNWHNVVITLNGSVAKYYLDGAEVDSTSYTGQGSLDLSPVIGGIRTSSGINSSYYTNGSIDQVRIFNKALDAGEVLQLYNEPNN